VSVLAHAFVPRAELGSAWRLAWAVLVPAAVASALFCRAWLRLRRRGRPDLASVGRALLFAAGLAVLLLALLSPLDAVGEGYLLSAHMLQHMAIGDAAPALLLAAVRGPLVLFLLPASVLGALARVRPLRRGLSALLEPAVAFGVWAAVFAIWHVPAAYDFVLSRPLLHGLEHASFIVAGLLVWTQLVDPARRGRLTRGQRLGFAALLFACGQVLAYVLVFSYRPLYPAYADQPERVFGLSPLRDQQLAGLVMMAEQLLALGTCAVLLARGVRPFAGRTLRPRGGADEGSPA
jgi:cytochrome c oxidase assembly factor CtaG